MKENYSVRKQKLGSFSVIFVSILCFLFLLTLPNNSGLAIGGPDLVVNDLELSPSNPSPGEEVQISAQISNQGTSGTGRFYVRLYVNEKKYDYKSISFGLDARETDTVNFSWTAEAGRTELKVVVDDPFDKIQEGNENNNSYTKTIKITRPAGGDARSELTVAVVSFKDESNSGFANVSDGVADMLVERLVNSGFNVLEREQIESVLFEQQLNPSINSELARASRIAGADALIVGSVTGIDIRKQQINLGFISVTGATVKVNMSYRVISSYTSQIIAADSETVEAEGQTDASFKLGTLLNSVSQVNINVCAGGFRTNKNAYAPGEVINVGYRDPGPPSSFAIRFYNSTGPIGPNLISTFKSTSPGNSCVTWNWNPPSPLPPGNYSVKLYPWPPLSVIATKNFSVSAGASSPSWVGEITFGTKQFEDSIVGDAVEEALDKIASNLSFSLNSNASMLINQRGQAPEEEAEEGGERGELKCQVISVQADNRVVLAGVKGNCGRSEGIEEDDIFYMYSAESFTDPNTGELIEIIPKTEEPKGKVIVLSVFENLCRAQTIGNFMANEGDLAILKK